MNFPEIRYKLEREKDGSSIMAACCKKHSLRERPTTLVWFGCYSNKHQASQRAVFLGAEAKAEDSVDCRWVAAFFTDFSPGTGR